MMAVFTNRLLFNLHSLAAEMLQQPTFILNNLEISRLNLQPGSGRNEFLAIVDVDETSQESERAGSPRTKRPRISQIGTWR